MKPVKLVVWLSALWLLALACTLGGGQDVSQDQSAVDAGEQTENLSPPEPQVENLPAEEAKPQAQAGPLLPDLALPEVELLTPTEGVGVKPLFEWTPADGAVWYGLVLQNAEGKSYWAWMGAATSIYLGGTAAQPAENSAGPVLESGMRWAVTAYDAEGNLIAASMLRPISP